MHIRNKDLNFDEFLKRVTEWTDTWSDEVTKKRIYWVMLLERAMMTIMLDLGASEWKEEEHDEKQALLENWKQFFNWLLEERVNIEQD
jgi:hypothetical protein